MRACVVFVERLFSCAWWGEGTSRAVCRRGRVCGSWRRATEADGGWTATSRGPSVRLTRVPRSALLLPAVPSQVEACQNAGARGC